MPVLTDDELDQPLQPLTEQALEWLVRLHSGRAQALDWDAYADWCQASPQQHAAALQAERLWTRLGSALQRPASSKRRLAMPGLALALLSALIWQGQGQGWMADEHTSVGEHRHIKLADGSQLDLAPQTRVDIDLKGDRRVLRLYSGELHVHVAADSSRPFVVEAANGSVRALGTGFAVRREGHQVRLIVTEHSVQVDQPGAGAARVVQAGQRLDYDENGLGSTVAIDADNATAWRRDRLVFDAKPLGEVLDELSRYQPGLLLVTDDRLRQLPVTGVFDTQDVARQLELLSASLPIRVRHFPWLTLVEPGTLAEK